jgi:hypothetical protein
MAFNVSDLRRVGECTTEPLFDFLRRPCDFQIDTLGGISDVYLEFLPERMLVSYGSLVGAWVRRSPVARSSRCCSGGRLRLVFRYRRIESEP